MSERDKIVNVSRRAALAAAVSAPLPVALPTGTVSADGAVTTLTKLAEEKNAAFMRGDMEAWAAMTSVASDFTLMQPFGGSPSRGFDKSPPRLAELARYFRNGRTSLEVISTYASSSLAVLVMIERQQAEVGGLPEQDWSLRVTEVYRKDGDEWSLAHRHADPLVRKITLDRAAALARGAE